MARPDFYRMEVDNQGESIRTGYYNEDTVQRLIEEAKQQMAQVGRVDQRIAELESTVAEQLRTINAINDSGEPTLTVIKQLDAKDQRIAELESANAAFAKRQEWWNERMVELESELLEQARVNGMGSEREATLMARVAVLEAQLVECEAKQEHCKSMFLQLRVAMGLGLHSDDDLLEYAKQLAECKTDAGRYRWMKEEVVRIPSGWNLIGWDAAIDAARRGKGEV